MSDKPTRYRGAELAALPFPPGRFSKQAFEDSALELRWFTPSDTDTQTPHDRDEFYFVVAGSGTFRRKDERVAFAPGDALFVAAHEPHRFEEFGADFAAWVVFYGKRR